MRNPFKKIYVQARITLLIFSLFVTVLTYFQVRGLYRNSNELRKTVAAQSEIKRLLLLTITYAKSRALPSSETIWKELGIARPLTDPWGMPYRLESGLDLLIWRSAGPDGVYGNFDDIFHKVPYSMGTFIDAPNPPVESTPAATSAQ